ncbi:uncharacterized protein LOC106646268 [Copidosoma floridanum]|uniref:uncharacterized protein LOC106646268 n=1 Tax=Copidosoma floridanum TaxID=29053 RepID=UPI0006C93CC7|nr:uncharacterized protein LOC106646268 [Copidosoma floridanum]
MSEDEDTTILLKSASRVASSGDGTDNDVGGGNNNNNNEQQQSATSLKVPIKEYEYIPPKKLRKPVPRHTESLTPLTSENQSGLVSFVAAAAGLAFGYDMGIGRQITPLVKKEFTLDCNEENMIVNVWFVGCLIAAVFGGILIDTCGRRCTMIFSLVFLTFGTMLSALANHYMLFLVARIICGYAGTLSAIAHCIYMAEVSSASKRGCNITLHQAGSAAGLLLAVIASSAKSEDHQWRFVVGLTSAPALLTCIVTIIFLQRSPSFMLLKRVANVPRVPVKNSWCYVFETLIVMMIMLALRQATGRQQVLYYAPRLFALLGICSNIARVTSMVALGVVRVFSTLLCLIVVERCGRRTALITSATICMTAVSLLSLLTTLDRGDELLTFPNEPCSTLASTNSFNGNDFLYKMKSMSPTGSPPPYPLLPTPLAIMVPNTETWTQVKSSCEVKDYNVMFIDNPVGVGFSYVESSDAYSQNNKQIAKDLMECMKEFYRQFPKFENTPTYIAGESYGGKMAVEFAYLWYQEQNKGNVKSNLKGVALADSLISPDDMYTAIAPYLFHFGLIDGDGYQAISKAADKFVKASSSGSWREAEEISETIESLMQKYTHSVDRYNVLKKVRPKRPTHKYNSRFIDDEVYSYKLKQIMKQVGAALDLKSPWTADVINVYNALIEDCRKPVVYHVEKLLNETDIKVFVFNGQLDLIINIPGTLRWIEKLKWKHAEKWLKAPRLPLIVNEIIEGYYKGYNNLKFYWVNRAGHMVSDDNPEAMEAIMKDLTDKKSETVE